MSGRTLIAELAPPALVFYPVAGAVWLLYAWITVDEREAERWFFVVPALVIPPLALAVYRLVRGSWDVMSPRTARLLRTRRGIALYSKADSYLKWTALPLLGLGAAAAVVGEVASIAGLVGCSGGERCIVELYLALLALAWLGGLGLSLVLIRAVRRSE